MTVTKPGSATFTGFCHHGGDNAHLHHDSQHGMLALANKTVLVSQSLIPEIEEFLRQLSKRIKTTAITGVPTFLRNLKKSQAAARRAVQELSSAPQLPKDALQLVSRRVDSCAVELSKGLTHWDVLKRSRSLVAMNQAFQGSAKAARLEEIAKLSNLSSRQKELTHRVMKQQAKVEVHVVKGGAEWVDVRTLQPDRLARQMTDGGWGWGEHRLGDVVDEDEWGDIPLAKQIKRLVAAARINRHEYRIPRLRIVMPNIGEDNVDVNVLLEQFIRLDPSVHVIVERQDGQFLQTPPPSVEDAIRNLVGSELDGLTETLNLDHSVLVDLISDITHLRLDPKPWQAESTRAQIEEEAEHGRLMAKTIYPVLQGRRLVCTHEAAQHFHHVVGTVGTNSERERGKLLVPFEEPYKSMPNAAIRARFQELSIHELPSTVQLPAMVIPGSWTKEQIEEDFQSLPLPLPSVALDVARHCGFKSAKLSIFMYGWASGNMTLSSNKEIKAQLRTLVETHRRRDDDYGPSIWRVDVTRNLLAKSAKPCRDSEGDVHTGRRSRTRDMDT
ncbi:hypothetical protein C2857_001905 [Epichloe festucae Fl1]|uniref:DUF1308 domain-containing protein n=1 Tax=Epichloe festucae (strain Fl1) TaxID=877507 RepID=A0A7S9KUE7_EPIFF|nr:hypothetical protein C2857_001905 [Epichloe festucae Fl1]